MRPRPSCDFGRHTCEAIAWFLALFSPRTHRPPALPRGASQGSLWALAAALLSLSARCAPGVLVDPGHCFSLSSRAVRPRGPCGPWPLLFFFFPCGAPQGSLWTLAAALLLLPVRCAPGVLVDPGYCFSLSSRAVCPRGPCGPWPLLFFFFPCGAPQGSLWTLAAAFRSLTASSLFSTLPFFPPAFIFPRAFRHGAGEISQPPVWEPALQQYDDPWKTSIPLQLVP